MNDINSRAGSAIDLKLSNTQTFNRWKKKRKEKKKGKLVARRGEISRLKYLNENFLTSVSVCLKLLQSQAKKDFH